MWLLDNGADPSIPDGFGRRAIHCAAEYPVCLDLFKLLESRGQDINLVYRDEHNERFMKTKKKGGGDR